MIIPRTVLCFPYDYLPPYLGTYKLTLTLGHIVHICWACLFCHRTMTSQLIRLYAAYTVETAAMYQSLKVMVVSIMCSTCMYR